MLITVWAYRVKMFICQFFRTVASTNMNDVSSRSHAIFTILFTQVSIRITLVSFHVQLHCMKRQCKASIQSGQGMQSRGLRL